MDFLGTRMKSVAMPANERIKAWLADLASPDFGKREAAHKELVRAGEMIEPALRRALETSDDFEVRRRLAAVLDSIPVPLRELRAIEVLERLGSAEARRLLGELAKGAPEGRLTREAKASLVRLEHRGRVGERN